MVFQWGACIRVPHDCCCCHGCCASLATVDACRHSFTLCPVMLRPPTLSIQIYACAHTKEVLTFKSSTRISWSRQLLLEIDTYIHRNETCTTAASLHMDCSVHVWKYWLSRSPNGRRALRVTVSRCTRKPARLSDGRFNGNPHVSFSWPRIMLQACESTLIAPRPVVIRTLFMFSRNGSTSTRSQRLVVRCTFHSVLAEMELHKSALIEWVRTQHPHNSSGWQNHGNWI